MLSKKKCIENANEALLETGFVQCSFSNDQPDPILPGHPVHNAIVRLEKWYSGILPPEGRRRWKNLLRFSRDRDDRVFEASDAISRWLSEEYQRAVEDSTNGTLEDGLVEMGFQLRWQDNIFQLQPQTWLILQYVGQRSAVKRQELEDGIWGDGEILSNSTFSQAIRRTNVALAKAGIQWRLRQNGGQVVRELLDGSDDLTITKLVTVRSC